MKKLIFFLLLSFVTIKSFGQSLPSITQEVNTDYLKKSKQQKTISLATGIPGLILFTTGLVMYMSEFGDGLPGGTGYNEGKSKTGEVLMIIGGGLTVVAISFTYAARKNKKKAMAIGLKNQFAPQLQQENIVYHRIPSLTLKINL